MPVVHKPFFKLGQFRAHLPANLGLALGFRTLPFCVLAVGRASRCEPRQTLLCLWASRLATMQRTAPIALVRGPLAGRAFTGLGLAPLAGPIGAKSKTVTFLEPTFCHLKTYRFSEVL